ncbi:MAG: gluconate 2-dehydrogenase subunit 3 family protein [Bryobacteraceae bacterium]
MNRTAQPGYYPGYSTLSQQDFWDAKTREVVLDRVNNIPPIRFFTSEEARLMEAIGRHIIPQDDRDPQHQIPIVPWTDERLYENRGDGYRHEDMPTDRDSYRIGLAAVQEIARHLHDREFSELDWREQELILKSLHDAKPAAGEDTWKRLPLDRFWLLLVKDCVEAYYAHPWAWDEIGYGGPAYPRAYMRLEHGQPEPWERDEKRYEWSAPQDSVSDVYEHVGGKESHYASPGQVGTH